MHTDGGPVAARDMAAGGNASRFSAGSRRIEAVDGLRGLALGAMVIYHVLWDLHAFGLSNLDPFNAAPLRWWGHGVAAAFLFLSGLSLWLADQAGCSWRHVAKRLAVLWFAAGLVTLVTWVVLPEAAVRFGLLHCLAVTNSVALLLRRWRIGMLVFAAAVSIALPLGWPWPLGPDWAWVGLSASIPPALDFRPVLPWLAAVLLGLAAARTALVPRLASLQWKSAVAAFLAKCGRHSLAVYLVHQPVLVGVVAAVTWVSGSAPPAARLATPSEANAFLAECTRSCRDTGGEEALCRSTCHCVLTAAIAPKSPGSLLDRIHPPQPDLRQAVAACRSGATRLD